MVGQRGAFACFGSFDGLERLARTGFGWCDCGSVRVESLAMVVSSGMAGVHPGGIKRCGVLLIVIQDSFLVAWDSLWDGAVHSSLAIILASL